MATRRLIAFFVWWVASGPLMLIGLPGLSAANLLLHQWRTAWKLMMGSVGVYAFGALVVSVTSPGGRPGPAWTDGLEVLGFSVTIVGGLFLLAVPLTSALFAPVDEPVEEPDCLGRSLPGWAWALAPSGYVQLLQGKPTMACAFGAAFHVVATNLLVNWPGTIAFFPPAVGHPGPFVLALAVLWLAAIWDAWDTQRKARQAEPAQEGSPSPA